MAKKKNTPLNIFMEALGLYFSNFDKFVKYMTFPVLGQVAGLCLVFLLLCFFNKSMPLVIDKVPNLSNLTTLTIIAIFVILPGMIIFFKAFWEYLIAYGAVNSMLENMLKSGKVYDFGAHTELIKRRALPFIGLWFLVGIFSMVSLIPFFSVPCAVLGIYFVLIFQVFTYEPNLSPLACVKKSLSLIKGHFTTTFLLLALVMALTYFLIPHFVNLLAGYINITILFTKLVKPIMVFLPISEMNNILTYLYLRSINIDELALFVTSALIAQIFIQYTLPLRSILWALWYRQLNGGNLAEVIVSKKNRSLKKRPSEKLMEQSHKKFATKKLDRNILRRAIQKDADN